MKVYYIILTFLSVAIQMNAFPSSIQEEENNSSLEKPLCKSYTLPPSWLVETIIKDNSHKYSAPFSRIRDEKIDMKAMYKIAYIVYKILMLNETDSSQSNPQYKGISALKDDEFKLSEWSIESDLRRSMTIEQEEEKTWLKIFGSIILDQWICDNEEDEQFKKELKKEYDRLISDVKSQQLIDMTEWVILNKKKLYKRWMDNFKISDKYSRDACDNLIATCVSHALELLTPKYITPNYACKLAMRASIPKYDGSITPLAFAENTMSFKAIEILLRWTDHSPVLSMIKKQFDPTDTKKAANNIWIINLLIRYGHENLAEDLTNKGNDQTSSLLLDTVLKNYPSLDYEEQAELRPLIRNIQKFVFNK